MSVAAERSRRLPARPEAVWAVLADFGDISRWAPDVDHSWMLSSGPTGPGSRRRVQVGRAALVEEITVWDPPHHLAYVVRGLPRGAGTVTNHWRLRRDGSAGTHAAVTTTVNAGRRPPQRVVERVVARRLATASDGMLEGLAGELHPAASNERAPT
jgi:uncharacterized protein YndB with AHSA1/START domain